MTTLKGSALGNHSLLITQGEFAVSDEDGVVINTLLGSCVACCLWDETAGTGGMNHLLLANSKSGVDPQFNMAGVAEMECLINGIIKLGGRRERLKAKVFGGANMLGASTGIGASNSQFALDFLSQEGIECISSSVGGSAARNVRFWPSNGRVTLKQATEPVDEKPVLRPAKVAAGNDVDLF